MIEQVSRATAGSPLLADTHEADKQAAAEAAVEAAFLSTSADAEQGHENEAAAAQPQGKKIIYEGDLLAATAAGIVTGLCLDPTTCSSCSLCKPFPRHLCIAYMGQRSAGVVAKMRKWPHFNYAVHGLWLTLSVHLWPRTSSMMRKALYIDDIICHVHILGFVVAEKAYFELLTMPCTAH